MKEIVIPFTWEHVWKVISITLAIIGSFGIYNGIINGDKIETLFLVFWGYVLSLMILFLASLEYNWDLNPFHKIGYCIRLAESWELKKNEQQSRHGVEQ